MNAEKMKICMIGATGVGKTSLVSRYVHSVFTEDYLATIGVKIDTRRLLRDGRSVDLMLWDLSGEDEFQSVQPAYLRGAAGYFLVVDGARRETLDTALALEARSRDVVPHAPFIVLLNKADLARSWELGADDRALLAERGFGAIETSAKSGAGVECAFERLVDAIVSRRRGRGP